MLYVSRRLNILRVELRRKTSRNVYKYRSLGALAKASKRSLTGCGHSLKEIGVVDTIKFPVVAAF